METRCATRVSGSPQPVDFDQRDEHMQAAAMNSLVFGAVTTWLIPLWISLVLFLVSQAVLLGIWLFLGLLAPKVAAIARTTTKEGLSQPVFYVLLAIGIFAILLFPFIPYNTFGEDIKMVKAEGLTLIKILAIILAVWTASISISEEIEGKTALTLLSKPIGRRQLILGKFFGVIAPVMILFIILGAFFLCSVSYKVVYDARESCLPDPTVADCRTEMVQILPGLALSFMEAVILASISVAISTRLPMLANLVICVSIYVLGHLVPVLVNSALGEFAIVGFVGKFLAAVLPVLTHFGMETAISTGKEVPMTYLVAAGVYSLLYCLAAMLLALLLFEERDLA
jgi:ABC-type transport system involved in multi-copper enzyme maturation permease subunit